MPPHIIAGPSLTRCIPESPRWLISQNKTDQALKVIKYVAKKNRKPLPASMQVSPKRDSRGTLQLLNKGNTERFSTGQRVFMVQ